MSLTRTIQIGICGFGTVGQGVWKHLERARPELEARLGAKLVLARAAVRDLRKKRDVKIPAAKLTADPLAIATDPKIDIVDICTPNDTHCQIAVRLRKQAKRFCVRSRSGEASMKRREWSARPRRPAL